MIPAGLCPSSVEDPCSDVPVQAGAGEAGAAPDRPGWFDAARAFKEQLQEWGMCGDESRWNSAFSPGQPSGGGGGTSARAVGRRSRQANPTSDGAEGGPRSAPRRPSWLGQVHGDYISLTPSSITVLSKTRFANSLLANAFRKCAAGNIERSPCLRLHGHVSAAWRPFFFLCSWETFPESKGCSGTDGTCIGLKQ